MQTPVDHAQRSALEPHEPVTVGVKNARRFQPESAFQHPATSKRTPV